MFNRRRSHRLVLLAASSCLVLVAGAAAANPGEFIAASTPTHVKPSTAAGYTITLTSSATSEKEADRAKIGIPPGFTVDPATVTATTSTTGGCTATAWVADGTLIADGKINLTRPGGNPDGKLLCPGASLTVAFSATSAADEAAYTWATELLRDTTPFVLTGSQPTVQVDGTPPTVAITAAPPLLTNATSAAFEFSSSEPAQCKLDGSGFSACSSPKNYANLIDGLHTFTVRATDAAGNTTEKSHTWTVDLIPPTVSIATGPSSLTNSRSASFTFTASDSTQCKLDTGEFVPCSSPAAYDNLPDGPHSFTVRAIDAAQNSAEATRTWTVDGTPPTVQITGDKPGDPTNSKTATFTFTASETSTFACKLDTGSFAGCSSPKGYSSLADGQHTFTVRATDVAGNPSLETTYTWTVDSQAPTVSITARPDLATQIRSASFTFTADAPTQCRLDGGAFAACFSPATYSGLPDGSHTFTVRATDAAGNTGQDVYTWTVDNIAPSVVIVQKPTDPSDVKSPTFAFTFNEGTAQCKLDAAAFSACSSPKSYTNLNDGQHTFAVRSTDAAGNTGQDSYTWRLETQLAVATLVVTPRDPSTDTSSRFEFRSRTGATFECSLDGAAFAACTSPAIYGGLAQGQHSFAIRAKDGAGTGPPASYSWRIDSLGPSAAITQAPGSLTSTRSATFGFTANEAGSFACQLDGGGFGPCASPVSYQGLADGPHTFTVRPTDVLGNVGAPVSYGWRVDGTAPETTLASKPAVRTAAASATFAFSANEPAAFQCKVDTGAFAPCTSPKVLTGLARIGHVFEARAVDAAGNVDATPAVHRWTVVRATTRRAKAASALLAPRRGARLTSPPLLRWRPVARASFYNVQLFRGSVKILSAWPTRTRLQLRARWLYLGREQRLKAGTYRWYVWPAFGKGSSRRYGRLLGQSMFTMRAGARR